MAVNWPLTLPQDTLQDGFQYSRQTGLIRTDMDAGYPKTRRRFTATVRTYNISMVMTKTQLEAFETFYFDSLQMGTVRVNFPDPLSPTQASAEFRWVGDGGTGYTVTQSGDTQDWIVSFTLERLP